jgi:cyanophycinase
VKKLILLLITLTTLITGCSPNNSGDRPAGKLFIIGGGNRTEAMLNELVDLAGIRSEGYMFVLPMSGSEPDSAILWAKYDFGITGIRNITGFNFEKGTTFPQDKIDSLKNAKLIYISGGDQSRFMDVVLNTPVYDAIHEAYKKGAVISGTSAGAAVMSKKMITGNQKKYPQSNAGFITIEAENIETAEGLAMLTDVMIDQHFIKRQRLNRLIAAAIENPEQLCVGIDESTAIIVDGNIATVTGNSQVIVIKNSGKEKSIQNGHLGMRDFNLSVYLPGQSFKLRQ